jgi:uncharacterized protein (UPF0332 family)
MSFDNCLKKGMIKKSESTKEKIEQSIVFGDKFLKSAKKNFDIEELEVCEIISYNALFHYARALLFKKGYNERSHACLFIALKKLYPEHVELFERADKILSERHNLIYMGLAAEGESVEYVIEFVEEFRDVANKLLEKE